MSSKKKVFFHYEAKGSETYTKSIFLRENESCVAEIIQTFTKSFNLDHPEVTLGNVQVTDASGNTFSPSDDLFALLQSKDDCYVVTKKKKSTATTVENTTPIPPTTAVDSVERQSQLPPTPPAISTSSTSATASTEATGRKIDHGQLLTSVEDLIGQGALRKARDICVDITSNASASREHTRALEYLCHIAFECKKYDDVVRYGEQALAGFSACQESTPAQKEKKSKKTVESSGSPPVLVLLRILLMLGRSQSELGEAEEALDAALQGLLLLRHAAASYSASSAPPPSPLPPALLSTLATSSSPRSLPAVVLEVGTVTLMSVTTPKATPSNVISQQKELITLELDFKSDLTTRLFQLGRNEEAGAVVNALIGHPSSVSHVLSLLVYAEIAAAYNKIPEAVQGALKAVVLDPTNKRCKALVGKLLGSEVGLQEVYKQVPPVAQAAAAYSFLAGVVKDLSLLDTAETLLRQVVKLDPRKDATHFLSLVHVLEGKLDLTGSLNTIVLAINSQQRRPEYVTDASSTAANFFPGSSVCDWCREWSELLAAAMREDKPASGKSKGGGKASTSSAAKGQALTVSTDTEGLCVTFMRASGGSAGAVMSSSGKASSGTRQSDGDYALVHPVSTPVAELLQPPPQKADTEYDSNRLDILALAFTAVKLLFLLGRLGGLPPLIRHLERARRASKQPLHETNIRNEHAYYLCIVQLLACYTAPPPASDASPPTHTPHSPFVNRDVLVTVGRGQGGAAPLYVIGDSHVLSSAYAVVSVASPTKSSNATRDQRVLIPKLVTGVKQWHLRKESSFYTKEIFRRTLASVPAGAEVVLLLGEIDCREGLLAAVQRGVYEDVAEAMRATLAVFKPVVQDMVQRKRLTVYLHPLLPVLDVTRQVVLMYNELYKAAMADVKGCHWLDMERHFVEPRGTHAPASPGDAGLLLREDLKLDGTHVHPRYVSLLETALVEARHGSS